MKKIMVLVLTLGVLSIASAVEAGDSMDAGISDAGICERYNADPQTKAECEELLVKRALKASEEQKLTGYKQELAKSRAEMATLPATVREYNLVLGAARNAKNACACYSVPRCAVNITCVQVMCGGCGQKQQELRTITVRAGMTRGQVAKMIALAVANRPTLQDLAALEKMLIGLIGGLEGRLKTMEEKIPVLEQAIKDLEERVKLLEEKVAALEKKMGDVIVWIAEHVGVTIEQNRKMDGIGKEFDLRLGVAFAGAKGIYALGGGIGADLGMTESLKLVIDAQIGGSFDSAFTSWGDLGLMWFTDSEVFGIGGGAVVVFEAVEDEKDFFLGACVMIRLQMSRLNDKDEKRTVRFFGQVVVAGGASSTEWGDPNADGDRPRLYEFGGAGLLSIGASFNP